MLTFALATSNEDEVATLLAQKCFITTNNKPLITGHFIEFEIVTEPAQTSTQCNPDEDALPLDNVESDDEQEAKITEQNRKIIEHYARSTQGYDNAEFENNEDWIISESQKDTFFKNFLSVISQEPEQILRYYEDNTMDPLWASAHHRPKVTQEINQCQCGAERVCEFQIMPQLLYLLEVEGDEDPMDWGTLVVYTCKNSCGGKTYREEYMWPQQIYATK